jgi:tRNA threonylcarbamoyladenosine biosynthesis protein TsaE
VTRTDQVPSVTEWPVVVRAASPEATRAVAASLAQACSPGDVILLIGDLGAGKTVFAQGFAAALGVEGHVTSPTFALVRQYPCVGATGIETLIHADVYRTGSLGEVVELALAELVEEHAVALIEWGDRAAPALGGDALDVRLEPTDSAATDADQQRTITITGRGGWSRRVGDVARVLAIPASGSTR